MDLMRSRSGSLQTWLRCLLLVAAAAALSACDPTIFKKPAQDFVAELRTLRDGYFGLLKLRRDAQYERTFSQQRQAYWAQPALAIDADTIKADQKELEKARKRPALPAADLLVRQRAFDVLDSYAGTILALASDDDTSAIAAELGGLGGDLKGLAEVAKTVNVLRSAGDVVENWLPTVNVLIGALQKITEIVSNVVRTNAIRDVVYTAHDPIKKLLAVLEEEAKFARKDALDEFDRAKEGVEKSLSSGIKAPADARSALEYQVALQSRRDALAAAPALAAAFAEASKLQDKLFKSAAQPDAQELMRQALLFRQQVRDAKSALDAIP